MKTRLILLFLFFGFSVFAQESKSTQIGQTSLAELQMMSYDKDPSATALVLYDEQNYFHTEYNKRKRVLAKDVYYRYKILKNEGLKKATFTFVYGSWIELSQIQGITYNLNESGEIVKSELQPENIITDTEEDYTRYIVNLPNVKVGSVFELKFRVSNLGRSIADWYFQTDIPKVKSRISRLTPKTMNYIVNLTGLQELSSKENIETLNCFEKRQKSLKCRFAAYEMENVPAFKSEPFMPHRSNLKSKLSFRLSYFVEKGLWPYRMMTKWSQFDGGMKRYYFNKEMTKKTLFRGIIPKSVFQQGSKLSQAKKIYYTLQQHFSWNGNETGDLNRLIKRNVKRKEGSLDLIATTLYNALKAADIEVYYVAVSTRSKGPIDREYPNYRDFNYTVIKAVIDGKDYFLDATDKSLGFGYVQPFANVKDGRVLDYTVTGRDDMGYEQYKGSYWQKMSPPEASSRLVTSEWSFEPTRGFYGKINNKRSGYDALTFRRDLRNNGIQNKRKEIDENSIGYDLIDYQVLNENDKEKRIEEYIRFEFSEDELDELDSKDSYSFTPIQEHIFSKNPFDASTRDHPIDFLYPRNLKYRFTLNIPEGYDVSNIPKNVRYIFPNDGGSYVYQIQKASGKLRIYINFKMVKTYYDIDQYPDLRKLFQGIYNLENTVFELVKD